MRCPRCQHEAPGDAEFCPACGGKLRLTCPACGTANAVENRFCTKCGEALSAEDRPAAPRFGSPHTYTPAHLAEKILTSRAALEGERKLVTVLFVDVSGFTAISERLDPEDVHGLMDRAFELMLAEIHRYEGTVNQFLGDGLMALFGAPIGHEDHALRAVHAALDVQRTLRGHRDVLMNDRRIDFQVRMGLNTGLVVVGKIGDNLRMDYTAVGDTTNLAARLLALGEPGQILVSDHVVKIVGPYFVFNTLGDVSVKGKTLPVRAYRVEGTRAVRSRLEAVAEQGLTPLVAREQELALLQDRLAEARDGRGQSVFVFGEAGIGKSRLLAEFRRRVESEGELRWLTGRCISYGQSIAYLPILDVVRELLGIREGDPIDAVERQIELGITALGRDLGWTVPLIRALLSLDPGDPAVSGMVPVQRHGRTMEAIRALVDRESERRPVVVLIEDLHWIDRHAEDVIRLLLDGIAVLRVMVFLTYRPGYSPSFGEQTYHTRIALRRLPATQAQTMVDRVLGSSRIPGEVRTLILDKAEGNPLFVEELAKALVEDGTLRRDNGGYALARSLDEAVIPETIQGVIMARIDRLPEASKSALQIASVIGREFTARLVERVSALERDAPKALGELRAVELIYEKSVYPELAYMFKHALTHDVAYESLLKQRRRILHRRVGEVIEELYPDRLTEFYETLAWHYTQAEMWEKGVEYLLRASAKARAQFAFDVAARYAGEAASILDTHEGTGDVRANALEALGDLESLRGRIDPANEAYDRAAAATVDPLVRQRVACKRHRLGVTVRDGAKIAYYEHGMRGPTLFLMHPLFYGVATFQPLVELLSEDFRLVMVDPRGTGASDRLPSGYGHREHLEDVRAVIRALGDEPVVLIGISRGGTLAVRFATVYPELIGTLVLIGTTPMAQGADDYPHREIQDMWKRLQAAVEAADYEVAIRSFLSMTHTEPGTQKAIDSGIAYLRTLDPEVIRNFFLVDQSARDIRSLLPQLRVRTLVMHGDADRLVPLEAGRYVAEHIPGAQFYVVKGRQHNVLRTAITEVAGVIRDFLQAERPT